MKLRKIFFVLFLVILLFGLSACASDEEEINNEEEAAEAINDVGQDVSELSASLNEVNDDLG